LRIALIAPPFISIPPRQYGGTELFIAQLAVGLRNAGLDVVVYTNGESTVEVEKKWLYPQGQWPLSEDVYFSLRDMEHHAWAVQDAARDCDVIHVNNLAGLTYSRFVEVPFVYTVHHPNDQALTDIYQHYPNVHYVCISQFQADDMELPNHTTIHHGIDPSLYQVQGSKQEYLAFLGRVAPVKGVHLAIEVARKTGIPLKIAGQLQPLYEDYWQNEIKPQVDGQLVQFVGEVGLAEKNRLLGDAKAFLFPIQWHEPFGLVLVEAMACGTPVLALPGGSVAEIVQEGVSGHICQDVDELAARANDVSIPAMTIRNYVDETFSLQRMVNSYVELYQKIAGTRQRGMGLLSGEENRVA
jgi:glycosyltransferase involved in cell wall biosynthesis